MLLTYVGRKSEENARKSVLNQQQHCGANRNTGEAIKNM
jgi:hypothetical protein